MGRSVAAVAFSLLGAALSGCGAATYVDKGQGESEVEGMPGQVVFRLSEAYKAHPPSCIAILPFAVPPGGESQAALRIDQAETVRRAIYAHLSPQGKRDIELARIDFVLAKGAARKDDLAGLGRAVECDSVIVGDVTEYGSQFLGVYSRVAVGANLKMVRASDGEALWEGRHVAESHGGSLPLSPIGLAMGILEAAANVREEQVFRVIDDLARRLVGTIPDDRIAVLEDPAQPPPPGPALKDEPATVDAFVAGLTGLHDADRRAALLGAIDDGRFGAPGTDRLYREAVALSPGNAGLHARYGEFLLGRGDYDTALAIADKARDLAPGDGGHRFLRGRALLKLGRLEEADRAIVEAIARDDSQALFYNGLGFVNSKRGNVERAVAAYRMAVERDPANGFAYYNMGVGFYNTGDLRNAADSFYGAGLAYIKTGHYGQAEKALADLTALGTDGIDVGKETETLKQALAGIGNGKGD